MTQLDDSKFTNAVFADWYDCNWERLDSLLDARQSGDHERLASLLDARQRALQSRASGAVFDQPKRQHLLDGLQGSIERAIIEQVATALGLDNPQAKPRHQRQHTLRPPDGLLTASEAAVKLRCSIKTFNGYVAAGALKYVTIGHGTKRPRKMFTDADLDEFIAKLKPARTFHVRLPRHALAVLSIRLPAPRSSLSRLYEGHAPGVKPKK